MIFSTDEDDFLHILKSMGENLKVIKSCNGKHILAPAYQSGYVGIRCAGVVDGRVKLFAQRK